MSDKAPFSGSTTILVMATNCGLHYPVSTSRIQVMSQGNPCFTSMCFPTKNSNSFNVRWMWFITFITPENPETNYIEIAQVQSIQEECRNWKCPTKMLPKAPKSTYILTVICMLTGYVFWIPLKTKTAEEIVNKYLTIVAFTFGNSRKILSGNGTEFKSILFEEVAKQLGVEKKIYSPVYRPQANGQIEGFHKFLKECISKHMENNLECDDILPLAATAYNWFPNEH